MTTSLVLTAFGIGLAWMLSKIYSYYQLVSNLKSRGVPLRTCLISPKSLVGNLTESTIPFIIRGRNSSFDNKWLDFEIAGWNMFSFTSIVPSIQATVWVADKNIIKDITSQRVKFPKQVEEYYLLALYGQNVVITEGEEWKKHKRISQPTFSEQNNRLVWSAVSGIMSELIDEVWGTTNETIVDDTLDLTTRLALMVLGMAAFGKEMHWETNSDIPPGHEMDFAQALYLVCSNTIPIYAMPNWAMGITERLKKIRTAASELDIYTTELIQEKLKSFGSGKDSEKGDLLTNLVAASEEEGKEKGGTRLSNSELRGNIFIFLLAGHETTAHTLAYCFGLLALYPDEQEKLLQHIRSVLGDSRPTYEDFSRLTRVQATVNETLRLFPPVQYIPKVTADDTTFTVSAADPKSSATRQVSFPAGTNIMIHNPGLHFNPRYWPDPYVFKPDRFLGDWDRDAFLPFSGGARACAGRKFAEVELTAVLTYLIPRYTIHLKPEKEAELGGLSMKDKMQKLLKTDQKITLTPTTDLGLVFKRRRSV